MMDTIEVERHDLEAEVAQEQQQGGHRINRRVLIGAFAGAAIIVAIAGVAGIKAAGNSNQTTDLLSQPDDSTQSTRDRASTEDLRAEALPHATPAPLLSPMLILPKSQTVAQQPQTQTALRAAEKMGSFRRILFQSKSLPERSTSTTRGSEMKPSRAA